MHIADLDAGNLGTNWIVGGGNKFTDGCAYSTNEKRLVRLSSASLGTEQPTKVFSTKAVNMASGGIFR